MAINTGPQLEGWRECHLTSNSHELWGISKEALKLGILRGIRRPWINAKAFRQRRHHGEEELIPLAIVQRLEVHNKTHDIHWWVQGSQRLCVEQEHYLC